MRTVKLGIQDFENVRSNNQFYVDKTAFLAKSGGESSAASAEPSLLAWPNPFLSPDQFGSFLIFFLTDALFRPAVQGSRQAGDGLPGCPMELARYRALTQSQHRPHHKS